MGEGGGAIYMSLFMFTAVCVSLWGHAQCVHLNTFMSL